MSLASKLHWSWEIKRRGSGPHAYLNLEFAATQGEIEQQLQPLLEPHYQPMSHSSGAWINRAHSHSCYTTVTLEEKTVSIHLEWTADYAEADRFLKQLLSSTTLELMHWQVLAGGEGYQSQEIQAGSGVESFLHYAGDR